MTRCHKQGAAILFTLFLYLFGLPVLAENDSNNGEERDFSNCLNCHNEGKISAILNTPHAQKADERSPFAQEGCPVCHGKDEKHPKRTFGQNAKVPVEEQNQVCLGCHQRGNKIHWQGSIHESSDLSCASCHTVHTDEDVVLDRTKQTQVCFGCHAEQKAQSFQRSRHPIREAKMVCTDCHNPHGSTSEYQLVEDTVNQTCYQCHVEKRGPFLWEHPPVQENCALCHNPHGSTQDRMLKVRAPYLCQQCHSDRFHPSTLYDGSGVPPEGAQSRLLAESCLNCHYTIHGSNHPAGVAFTR